MSYEPCEHGHFPSTDDPVCLECLWKSTRNKVLEEVAQELEQESLQHPGTERGIILRDIAKGIRSRKSVLPPRGSNRTDGRTENPGSLDDLTALCPHCGGEGLSAHQISREICICPHCSGKGRVEVSFADGDTYAEQCTVCKTHIGGCIVGGTSSLKEVPKPKICPFCGKPTEYIKVGD